jgi:hypothetical protein
MPARLAARAGQGQQDGEGRRAPDRAGPRLAVACSGAHQRSLPSSSVPAVPAHRTVTPSRANLDADRAELMMHNYRAQVHPVTLCMRRELVMALGGWMALPASGDTGLLLAANAISTGYFITAVGLLYRKWPGQMTSQAAHIDETEWPARVAIIEARASALAHIWAERTTRRTN